MRRTRAFTLVELLVVIGIITVLTSMLLPVVNKARAHAQQVVCASNMRQIAMACLAYAAGNKNILPVPYKGADDRLSFPIQPFQAIDQISQGMADWNRGTLIPYLCGSAGARQSLFTCPAMGSAPRIAYGAGGASRMVNFDYTFNEQFLTTEQPLGLFSKPHARNWGVRITRVRHAENKIALMELIYSGDMADDPVMSTRPSCCIVIVPLMATRHGVLANASFLDGHVELMNPQWFEGMMDSHGSLSIENDAWHHYIEFSSNQ